MPWQPLALTGLLAFLLISCQSGEVASSYQTATGDIVVPPAAGTAQWRGVTGEGPAFLLGTASVQASGRFLLSLPQPPPFLPAQGNTALLPYAPSAELVDFKGFSCPQGPGVSDPLARLVIVKLGSYVVGGQQTGQLLPAMTTVSSGTQEMREVTTETYVYADRPVSVTGTLNCTLTRQSGSSGATAFTAFVNYLLQTGWNKITVKTTLYRGDQVSVSTSASTKLDGVQWRYLPVTP